MEIALSLLFFYIILRNIWQSRIDRMSRLSIASFVIMWAFVVLTTLWNPGGMYPVSTYSFVLVFVNVVFFTIGFISIKNKKRNVNTWDDRNFAYIFEHYVDKVVESRPFLVIIVLAVIYTSSRFFTNFQTMIISQSLSDVRGSYYENADALYGTGFSLIRDWILTPLSKISIPLFAYLLFKRKNSLCLLLGVYLFEYASLSGGRFGYATVIAGVFFVIICVFHYENKKKRYVIMGAMAGVFFFLLISVTLLRSGVMQISGSAAANNSETLSNQMAIYMTGPIGAFDYAIKKDYVNQLGGHTYGVATFCSIDRLLQPILKIIDPSRLPMSNAFIGYKQENMIRIFDFFGSYNALYTWILFFYMDFGFIGVVVLPLLFGILFRNLFIQFRRKPTVPMLVILTWMFDVCLHSIYDFSLISHMHPIMLIALWIWHSNTCSIMIPDNKRYSL